MAGMTPEQQKLYDDGRDQKKMWASEKESLSNNAKAKGLSTLTSAATIAFSADKMRDEEYIIGLVKLTHSGVGYLMDKFKLATYPAAPKDLFAQEPVQNVADQPTVHTKSDGPRITGKTPEMV